MTSISAERVTELPYRIRAVFTGVAVADNRVVTIDTRLRCQGIRFDNQTNGVFHVVCDSRPMLRVPPGETSFNFPGGVFAVYLDPQTGATGPLVIDFTEEELTTDPGELPTTLGYMPTDYGLAAATITSMAGTAFGVVLPGVANRRLRILAASVMLTVAMEAGGAATKAIRASVISTGPPSIEVARVEMSFRSTAVGQRIEQTVQGPWHEVSSVGVPLQEFESLEVACDPTSNLGAGIVTLRATAIGIARGIYEPIPND